MPGRFRNQEPDKELSKRARELRDIRERIGISQKSMAELLLGKEAHRSTYANWENDTASVPLTILEKARALDRQRVILAGVGGPNFGSLTAEDSGRVKIYGGVLAGTGNASSIDALELDVPIQFARDDYGGMVVQGDSMLPLLAPGDTVIFRDWTQPKAGYVFAAKIVDGPDKGNWVVKLLAIHNDRFVLRSLNGEYEDVFGPFQLAGFLVGIVHDEEPERLIRLNPYGIRP